MNIGVGSRLRHSIADWTAGQNHPVGNVRKLMTYSALVGCSAEPCQQKFISYRRRCLTKTLLLQFYQFFQIVTTLSRQVTTVHLTNQVCPYRTWRKHTRWLTLRAEIHTTTHHVCTKRWSTVTWPRDAVRCSRWCTPRPAWQRQGWYTSSIFPINDQLQLCCVSCHCSSSISCSLLPTYQIIRRNKAHLLPRARFERTT